MQRQWVPNIRHGTTGRGRRNIGPSPSGRGQGGQRWMGPEIRHSFPDHGEPNMELGRTHNEEVHSQSPSGWEGGGQLWVGPDIRHSRPGRGVPNMETGRTFRGVMVPPDVHPK